MEANWVADALAKRDWQFIPDLAIAGKTGPAWIRPMDPIEQAEIYRTVYPSLKGDGAEPTPEELEGEELISPDDLESNTRAALYMVTRCFAADADGAPGGPLFTEALARRLHRTELMTLAARVKEVTAPDDDVQSAADHFPEKPE